MPLPRDYTSHFGSDLFLLYAQHLGEPSVSEGHGAPQTNPHKKLKTWLHIEHQSIETSTLGQLKQFLHPRDK